MFQQFPTNLRSLAASKSRCRVTRILLGMETLKITSPPMVTYLPSFMLHHFQRTKIEIFTCVEGEGLSVQFNLNSLG